MDVLLIFVAVLALAFLLSLTPPGVRFRRWGMARMYDRASREFEAYISDRKRSLFAGLEGSVLELGPGTGNNFVHFPPGVRRWIGVEPNPYMHPALREAAEKHGIEAEFREVGAEGMDVRPGSVDIVVSTLVLCSVADPGSVLRDVHAILRPGGRLVFIEHVAAPRDSTLRRWQSLLGPAWAYMADGCRPDRESGEAIRAAGFSSVEIEEFRAPRPAMPRVVSPLICGVAVK